MQANGRFDVSRDAQPDCDLGDGAVAAHLRIDKRFHGALDARSIVHMLAIGTAVPGSAGYVAVERVSGTLEGRRGAFLLQHSGTMDRGTPSLAVSVVPDSGSDALAGLRGRMTIDIVDGVHQYAFEYTLPEA